MRADRLREGIDTSNATGRMVAGVLASLAELELELGRERRAAAREARRARGQSIGSPKAMDASKSALAQRMHASGESATTIATTLGVSRATVYRVLADADGQSWRAPFVGSPSKPRAKIRRCSRAAGTHSSGLSVALAMKARWIIV